MTTKELLSKQMDSSGFQLSKCIEGWNPAAFDDKLTPNSMSLRVTLVHLAEVYQAVQKQARGDEHEWGSYTPISDGAEALQADLWRERKLAVDAVLAVGDDDKAAHMALDYIILHDAYHVGQLCSLRLSIEPDWNMYVIYGS